jgi:hypothetical protein
MVSAAPTYTAFADASTLGAWLSENNATQTELWVRIFKSGSGGRIRDLDRLCDRGDPLRLDRWSEAAAG